MRVVDRLPEIPAAEGGSPVQEKRRTIGRTEIIGLSDGSMGGQTRAMFPEVPEAAWKPFGVEPLGALTLNFGCYLLRTPSLTFLIDTGVGGPLLEDLASHGVQPEQVDAVAYTHLHGDHIGWNLSGTGEDLRPTFSNARYYVPREDWTYFVDASSPGHNANVRNKFLLLEQRGLVQLVHDGYAISPELTVWGTPGHSPGHSSYVVESEGRRAVIVGDAIVHPIQVGNPAWNSSYDQDPATAAATRRELVDRMANDGSLGAVSHFEAPGFGRIVRDQGTTVWQLK